VTQQDQNIGSYKMPINYPLTTPFKGRKRAMLVGGKKQQTSFEVIGDQDRPLPAII
jgi:hypothetical protein